MTYLLAKFSFFTTENIPFIILIFTLIGVIAYVYKKMADIRQLDAAILKMTDTADKIAHGVIDIEDDIDSYLDVGIIHNEHLARLKETLKKSLESLAENTEFEIRSKLMALENEKLQETTIAQTQFFANLSHEIRTPMNSILGIAQILIHDDNLTETQIKYVEEITESSDILMMIVSDILDLSKLQTGRLTLREVDFNFHTLLEELVNQAKFNARKKKLEFNYVVYGDIPRCLRGDDFRINQVLSNILDNSIKYTAHGGCTFRVNGSQQQLVFTVEDTGVGIDQDHIQKIFYPFEQHDKIPGQTDGTGIGLAIVKQLVELMGGKIGVKSEKGIGSTFTVMLPVVLGDESQLADDTERSEFSAQKAHILIVDDNEINLHVASGLIETLFKIDCDIAQSGKEALQKVAYTDYDLIFMDHMMPEMDGIETTLAIRNLGQKYLTLPIIALTANTVAGTKDILIRGGMNDFLSKPIQKQDLQVILSKWLPSSKIQLNVITDQSGEAEYEKTPLISALSDISGLDVNQSMQNVAMREDILEASMRILLSKIPKQIVNLEELLREKDLKRFSLVTHSLKGSFSNCGFMLIGKLASKLSKEAEVSNFAYCRENLPFFLEKMKNVEVSLQNIFVDNETVSERKEGTEKMLEEYKEKLIAAIEDYDYNTYREISDKLLMYDFGVQKNEMLRRLSNVIGYFDYNAARECAYDL